VLALEHDARDPPPTKHGVSHAVVSWGAIAVEPGPPGNSIVYPRHALLHSVDNMQMDNSGPGSLRRHSNCRVAVTHSPVAATQSPGAAAHSPVVENHSSAAATHSLVAENYSL
jgi:hypothetical protein